MIGIDQHFGQKLVEAVDHGGRQSFVETGEAQHGVGAFRHHFAHQFLIVFEHEPRPADDLVDQKLVAPIGDHRIEHAADQRCDVELFELGGEPGAHLRSQTFGIERFKHFHEQFARTRPNARIAIRCRIGQIAAHSAREIHRPHPARHDLRSQEVFAQEARHGVGDAILVFGDDGGVRDGKAERMAEQGRDGEPVREAAHHRRFRKGVDEAPCGMRIEIAPRQHEHERHQDEQPGRGPAHPARAVLRHDLAANHASQAGRPHSPAGGITRQGQSPHPHARPCRPDRLRDDRSGSGCAATGRAGARSRRQG